MMSDEVFHLLINTENVVNVIIWNNEKKKKSFMKRKSQQDSFIDVESLRINIFILIKPFSEWA